MKTASRFIAALAAIMLLAATSAFARGFIQHPELLDKIKTGMTAKEVEQILGPEASRSDFSRMGQISMNYVMRVWTDTYDVAVMIDNAGIVRDVQKLRRWPPN